jgi:hypothetical protein
MGRSLSEEVEVCRLVSLLALVEVYWSLKVEEVDLFQLPQSQWQLAWADPLALAGLSVFLVLHCRRQPGPSQRRVRRIML